MSNKISDGRKLTYYIGLGLVVLGVILFMSSFFDVSTGFGAMDPGFDMGMPSFFKRALFGMIAIIIGSVLMNIGAKGAAGSGIILDPDKAREDLSPYSQAAGKMINDVVSELDVLKGAKENPGQERLGQVIKIRCRECGVLNDEDAVFCKACGKKC